MANDNYILAIQSYEKGMSCWSNSDYDGAIAAFTEAIRLNPEYPGAHYQRSINYFAKGEDDKAFPDLDETIRLDPNHIEAHNDRGLRYIKKHEFDKGIADLDEVVRAKPDFSLHHVLGLTYSEKGEFAQAISHFSESIRLKPDFPDAYEGRGTAYCGFREFEKASADYGEAVRLHLLRGNYYTKEKLPFMAVRAFSQVIRLNPRNVDAHWRRALAKLASGQYRNAFGDIVKTFALKCGDCLSKNA